MVDISIVGKVQEGGSEEGAYLEVTQTSTSSTIAFSSLEGMLLPLGVFSLE